MTGYSQTRSPEGNPANELLELHTTVFVEQDRMLEKTFFSVSKNFVKMTCS